MSHQKESAPANNDGGSARKPGYHPSHRRASIENQLKKDGFYKKGPWRRIRIQALQRDHYQCQLRISPECTRIATEVHHIKPIDEYPELALVLDNLTSTCWNCHELTKPRGTEPTLPKGVRIIRVSDGGEGDGDLR